MSRSYETEGYLVVRGAFSAAECDVLDQQLNVVPLTNRPDWGVRFAKNVGELSTQLESLLSVPILANGFTCDCLLEDEVVEMQNTASGLYPNHQDAAYFPRATMSVAVALSELGGDNGGLAVLPRSHVGGFRTHRSGGSGPQLDEVSPTELTQLELARGDLVFIHPHLVHSMIGNRTEQLSRMFSAVIG